MNRPTSNLQMGFVRKAISAVLLLALAFRPENAAADVVSARKRDEARQKITAMTEAERTRLKSDFEKFRRLPADEQQKLRQLASELQNDADLKRTMKDYLDFLEPLSAGEREDLHSESDPARRAALVRTIMKEHQDRAESWTRRSANRRGLSSTDLDSVLRVVEGHIRKQKLRSPEQLAELDAKEGLARQVAIFELAFSRPMGGERAPLPVFSPSQPALLDEMSDAISDAEQRKRAGKGNALERVRNLIGLIYFGISTQIEARKPTEEILGEFLAKLSGAQQGEILRSPLDQQQRVLLRLYADAHPDQIPKVPPFPRWILGGDRGGRRNFGAGRGPDGENLRGSSRPEAGPDANPDVPSKNRRGPNEKQSQPGR